MPSFPHEDQKPLQYRLAAEMLADTAVRLGYDVDDETRLGWGNMMANLVQVDLRSEGPGGEDGPSDDEFRRALGVPDPSNEAVAAYASTYKVAIATHQAQTLGEHFDGRRDEGLGVVAILRTLSKPELRRQERLWRQFGAIAVLGQYYDSIADAHEDAQELPFTERQLVLGAARRAVVAARAIHPRTWIALTEAMHKQGANFAVARHLGMTAVPRFCRLLFQRSQPASSPLSDPTPIQR